MSPLSEQPISSLPTGVSQVPSITDVSSVSDFIVFPFSASLSEATCRLHQNLNERIIDCQTDFSEIWLS